jgi:hypothetical protein
LINVVAPGDRSGEHPKPVMHCKAKGYRCDRIGKRFVAYRVSVLGQGGCRNLARDFPGRVMQNLFGEVFAMTELRISI